MYNQKQLREMFQKIQVVRAPRRRLATFGASRIQYQLITDIPDYPDRSRLRTGLVTAEKPALITPDTLREQFHGFSSDAAQHVEALIAHYGEALRGLEYQFRNDPVGSRIELTPPDDFAADLAKKFDREDSYHNAIIRGADRVWELSLMKFIVEETLASFGSNLRELQDRGFFDGDERNRRRREREIENLLRAARTDHSMIAGLGAKLREYGLFEKYQDAFFQLLNR